MPPYLGSHASRVACGFVALAVTVLLHDSKAAPLPAGYSIPLVDITGEKDWQVIVDREPGQYLGHPTTVLLEDGQTMLCVYPKGHGRGALVLKRSPDGGRSWSERLPVPENWATSLETPTIHRVVDPQGKKRLIVWSGLFPARLAVTEDNGHTWSPLQPAGDWGGIVVMGSVEAVRDEPGRYLALFHDDGRFIRRDSKREDPVVFRLYQTESHDGGLTWDQPRELVASSAIHLCEPGLIRSPDGRQLAVLLRENSRRRNSYVMFSNDEGRTWTEPRELPAALTGDRHAGKYGPDGRLFLSFRDTTRESPTKGDWVGWVGTYEDIAQGREGQYRVRIMDNTKSADCAYPGVEILPDGTFVATTYGHWTEGESPYIVSVRFKLGQLDAKLAAARERQTSWGRILNDPNATGLLRLEVSAWPSDGKLALPAPFPNITSVHLLSGRRHKALSWVCDADAHELQLKVPAPAEMPVTIILETTQRTSQFSDGRIIFSALDARLTGGQAKLESHPGNHRIPLRADPKETVTWEYRPTRWGMYDVELAVSAEDGADPELQLQVGGESFRVTQPATARTSDDATSSFNGRRHWERYSTLKAGRFYLSKAEPFTVQVACSRLTGAAAINLKAVTLRPAPEGQPIRQDASGLIMLHARDAITHSVQMRYEPQTNKNCLGYWSNPNDWAEWKFEITQLAAFDVEVWQGCGKGHGGSDVAVEVGGRTFDFTVEETGHFQTFVPRRIGRVLLPASGAHALAIRPKRKQAGAVMDIRQVQLHPVRPLTNLSPAGAALLQAKRAVLLGDSITYAGEYVEFIETFLRLQYPEAGVDIINLGLPSETVSGLSEPGHAGGAFPRPDLHERLGRVLEKARPDVVVACYGMNDGIYHPFSEERFRSFQNGIRRLRERANASGAMVIHVTPPAFDPVPLKGRTLPGGLAEYRSPYEGYNEVLDRYSEWLLGQRREGWMVVDAHGPMNRFLSERRRVQPDFLLARDGVHANAQGHWLIAREFFRELGAHEAVVSSDTPEVLLNSHPHAKETLALVQSRQRTLKDAWLSHVGHARPGMKQGKPLAEAAQEAAEWDGKLRALDVPQLPAKSNSP